MWTLRHNTGVDAAAMPGTPCRGDSQARSDVAEGRQQRARAHVRGAGPAWCWEDAPRPRAAPAAPGTSCGSVSLCRELNLSCWGRPAARLQSLLYKVPIVALDGGG